ncbi:alpha-amylase family protein [Roseitranquillus sediminis]|uniref:alpha-amylase family protein n=1 Tax=Roseitranquillus sediminis TaxID=2809051 RepID=UPI001D0C6740|nr:alpha-amylase family protein [Roseitranquillus sediminis]MBM9595714.1 alpha-amylase family protein [Roseitranquillus sediminis]
MLDLWYKNAIIYCLDVETFMDANGDGVGDFEGLTHRLDHLEALGVNVIWLNPFYPTPNRDNGYDITDFYGVDPRLGHLGHFVDFSRAAADRGMKVIVDLVVNHTSTDHPWFRSACESEDSPYRDWYVWSKEKPEDIHEGIIFPGVQDAVWTYSERAEAWYLHRFYAHQADLNIANPKVREEIQRIMGFWLELGVYGFRIDAVPFLVEYMGLKEKPDREPLLLLTEMRDFLSWRRAGAIMLAEANVTYDTVGAYFGGQQIGAEDRMHMVFDFPLNQQIYLGIVRGSALPVIEALKRRPSEMSHGAQWANFLRNHDELSLDKLEDDERQEVFDALGSDPDMQIYERGLRRRLAPMMGGDETRLAMLHSLLLALPGTPVLWYGDEIGMGEDLSQPERSAVRTPMQWANEPHAGFSRCESKSDLVRPVVDEGPFSFERVNVVAQRDRPDSLMGRIQRLIRVRRACPEIGWGETQAIDVGSDAVLAMIADWRDNRVLTLHNFSAERLQVRVTLRDARFLARLLECDTPDTVPADQPIELEPYGFRWFRVDGERR